MDNGSLTNKVTCILRAIILYGKLMDSCALVKKTIIRQTALILYEVLSVICTCTSLYLKHSILPLLQV